MDNNIKSKLEELSKKYSTLQKQSSNKYFKLEEQTYEMDDDTDKWERHDKLELQGNYDGTQETCQRIVSDLKKIIKEI